MRLKCCWPAGEQVNEDANEMNLIVVTLLGADKKGNGKLRLPPPRLQSPS